MEAVAKHDPKLESRLTNRVDVLADRLGTLASAVSIDVLCARAQGRGDRRLASGARRERSAARRAESRARPQEPRAAELEKIRATLATLSTATTRAERTTARPARRKGRVARRARRHPRHDRRRRPRPASRGEKASSQRSATSSTSAQRRSTRTLSGLRRPAPGRARARRVDLLEHGVAAAASELAGKDAELAAVRERIDEAYEKVGAVIADLQRAVGGLSAQVAALENPTETTSRQAELEATVESMVEALSAVRDPNGDRGAGRVEPERPARLPPGTGERAEPIARERPIARPRARASSTWPPRSARSSLPSAIAMWLRPTSAGFSIPGRRTARHSRPASKTWRRRLARADRARSESFPPLGRDRARPTRRLLSCGRARPRRGPLPARASRPRAPTRARGEGRARRSRRRPRSARADEIAGGRAAEAASKRANGDDPALEDPCRPAPRSFRFAVQRCNTAGIGS